MSKNILVVDDDELMRRSLAHSLNQAGYKASNAANAEDALMMARRLPPDLVLLDIGLPALEIDFQNFAVPAKHAWPIPHFSIKNQYLTATTYKYTKFIHLYRIQRVNPQGAVVWWQGGATGFTKS